MEPLALFVVRVDRDQLPQLLHELDQNVDVHGAEEQQERGRHGGADDAADTGEGVEARGDGGGGRGDDDGGYDDDSVGC